jgi:hypothetical protein
MQCPLCGKACCSFTEAKRRAKRARRRSGDRVTHYRCGRWWHVGSNGVEFRKR